MYSYIFRFYCAGTFKDGPTGPCDQGFYCNGSAKNPNQYATPAGHYSLAQASFPVPCERGYYQSSERASSCNLCSKGSFCNRTGLSVPENCLKGYYCPDGTKDPYPCPKGTFNAELSKGNETDCDQCPVGMYCGSTGLTEPTGKCFAGYFCLLGSPEPNPVSSSLFLFSLLRSKTFFYLNY